MNQYFTNIDYMLKKFKIVLNILKSISYISVLNAATRAHDATHR